MDTVSLKPSRHPVEHWRRLSGRDVLTMCVCVFSCVQWLKRTHTGESQPLSQDQTLQVGSEVYQQAWCCIRSVLLCHVIHWYSHVDKTHHCHSNFYIIFVQDVFKWVCFFALCFIILTIEFCFAALLQHNATIQQAQITWYSTAFPHKQFHNQNIQQINMSFSTGILLFNACKSITESEWEKLC